MPEVRNQNSGFEINVIFSYESSFCMNGKLSLLVKENPNWSIEAYTQYPQKITMWAGIHSI